MTRRFRRLVAALLIPFVLVWSILVPRQAIAFAPVGAAPVAIVGTLASGAVVPIVIGATIAGIAYWAFKDLVSLDEVRVPAVDGSAGVVPPPSAPATAGSPVVTTCYRWAKAGYPDTPPVCSATQNMAVQSCEAAGGFYSGGQCYANGTNYLSVQTSTVSTCPSGYTASSGTCVLSNPQAAVQDYKQDFTRSGTTMSPISGDQAGGLSGTRLTTSSTDDTVLVSGKDSAGYAMQGKIIALPGGGSKVELKTQKVDAGGQTYVETQTFQTSSAGDVVSATKTAAQSSLAYDPVTKTYTEQANPAGSYSPSPTTGQATQFPSDYARQGEAASAAQSISNTLGPKIDAITQTGADPADPAQPPGSEFDDAFFQGTFTNLLGWQLPAHTSECPTSAFTFNSTSYTIDSHCQLVTNHFSALSAVMSVVWTVLALFILLGA